MLSPAAIGRDDKDEPADRAIARSAGPPCERERSGSIITATIRLLALMRKRGKVDQPAGHDLALRRAGFASSASRAR